MTADRGRAAVYDAETFAFSGSWLDTPVGRAEAQALAQRVVASPAWRRLGGPAVTFTPARGAASFCRAGTEIGFSDPVLVSTVTHELAHAVTAARHPGARAHGPTWRGWSVLLVEVTFGPDAATALSDAFRTYGLAVTLPRFEWTGAPIIGLR